MTNCAIGEVHIGSISNIDFRNFSIGSVFNSDIDDAEGRLGELESRLEEIKVTIAEAESRLDDLDD